MKFKEGDWVVVSSPNIPDYFIIEKIIEIDEINNNYTCYGYDDKTEYISHISWFRHARLLTEEEKVEFL